MIGRRKDEALANGTLSIRFESEIFDDIVQEDFIDTYNNLTIKTVMLLKWITLRCQNNVAFVLKCDDDTFVNVPNLLHYLLGGTLPIYNATIEWLNRQNRQVMSNWYRLNMTSDLLVGYLYSVVNVNASTDSKYYIPNYMYSKKIYPNFLSGSSYLMSGDVIPRLYNAARNMLLVHLEDVFITGICAEAIHVPRLHYPHFHRVYWKDKCLAKGSITQHYIKENAMEQLFDFVRIESIKCVPPDKYIYAWYYVEKNCATNTCNTNIFYFFCFCNLYNFLRDINFTV